MVGNVITQVNQQVRTLVVATRESHGVVMDLEHVALTWCVRFAGQINSRTVKGAVGLGAFQCAFQRASHPRAMLSAWRLYKRAPRRSISQTSFFREHFLMCELQL